MIFTSSSAIVQEANLPNQKQYMFETEHLTSLSLSKPLIAYAALELCENGLLEMDQPLAYLPSSEWNR